LSTFNNALGALICAIRYIQTLFTAYSEQHANQGNLVKSETVLKVYLHQHPDDFGAQEELGLSSFYRSLY
jgi:hypothetical protein